MLTACVTKEEFIIALEREEVLELTRLTDELEETIDEVKLQYALDRALCTINSYFITTTDCGKAFIASMCKQLTIDIARKYLDTTKSRPFVEEDYDKAIEHLKYACNQCISNCPLSAQEIEDILGIKPKTSRVRAGTRCIRSRTRPIGRIYNHTTSRGNRS